MIAEHRRRRVRILALVAGLTGLLLVAGTAMRMSAQRDPGVPTTDVTRGTFVERLELRGEIRPLRSVTLTAPSQSGDLQIVALARAGSLVHAGDVVVQFDGTSVERTIQEKSSEVSQANADVNEARAKARITFEQDQTALVKAQSDVDRARLDAGVEDLVARLDLERARLNLADAEQHVRETERKIEADRASANADIARLERQRDKVQNDLTRATAARHDLVIRAPADGVIHLLPNQRSGGPLSPPAEFREGDRAWAGAAIAELPDLSAVFFSAQVEEADRGRLQVGQTAGVRVDAIPDREFPATVQDISVLARVDFRAGFPPARNFDLTLRLDSADPRARPGMSASARIAVDRLDDVLQVPASAVFLVDGRPLMYRLAGSRFDAVEVTILRRTHDSIALGSDVVSVGDRVATARPDPDLVREAR